MKILIVTPYIPHPLAGHGGSEYVYGLVKYLSSNNKVTVILFLDSFEEGLVKDLKQFPVSFLFVRRMKGKQKGLLGNIQLIVLRLFQFFRSLLLWQPYYVSKYWDSEMARMIESETTRTQYDAVQIEFTQMAQYVEHVKSGRRVLREHDVNIRPWLRVYKSEKNPFKKFLYYLEYNRWMRYEPEIIKQFDSVLTFTETDSQFLNDVARVNHVHCHPRGIEVPEAISPYASREPLSLLFVGVYNHVANRDSVLWLCSEIFPEIQKRSPQATLYVVGKHPPDEVVEMASHNPGIKVMGFVPAIEEYYNRMQVFISPVRLGGGIKTKVLHAQSYGMAIVANSIGCEGITSVNPSTAIISDTVEGLADGVVALFNNPQQAASMAERGRELVVQQYGWTSVIKNLELFYQSKK